MSDYNSKNTLVLNYKLSIRILTCWVATNSSLGRVTTAASNNGGIVGTVQKAQLSTSAAKVVKEDVSSCRIIEGASLGLRTC